MDYWTGIDQSADLALIYGVRQRADMLAAQHSALALERERVAIERDRQEAEAEDRRNREEAAERVTAARKLLCKFEQSLELLEKLGDWQSEHIIVLAIVEENSRGLEQVFSELSDIRALSDVTSRTNNLITALLQKGAISTSPSKMLKAILPTFESALKDVRESALRRLFVHPKYQSEVMNLRSRVEKRKESLDRMLNVLEKQSQNLRNDCSRLGIRFDAKSICDFARNAPVPTFGTDTAGNLLERLNWLVKGYNKTNAERSGYRLEFQREEERLTFNSLGSQADLSRKMLLTRGQSDHIDPYEVHEALAHVETLLKNFDDELSLLAAKIPKLCLDTLTAVPNKNVSFFVSSSDQIQYENAAASELYDLAARTGQAYTDIRKELEEIQDYLQAVLADYAGQCQVLERVNTLLQSGDYAVAQQLLDGIKRVFSGMDYENYDKAVEEPFKLLNRAQDLEARLKKSQSSIGRYITSQKTKNRLWQEFYELSRIAETFPDCELRTKLVQKLKTVKELGGYHV